MGRITVFCRSESMLTIHGISEQSSQFQWINSTHVDVTQCLGHFLHSGRGLSRGLDGLSLSLLPMAQPTTLTSLSLSKPSPRRRFQAEPGLQNTIFDEVL